MDAREMLEAKQERAKLVTDIRALISEYENQEMPAEKREELTKMEARFDTLNVTIETEERQLERERKIGEQQEEKREKKPEDEEIRMAFSRALMGDQGDIHEYRDLTAGDPAQAGYLMAPIQYVNQIIKEVDDAVYIRQKATNKGPIDRAQSLGYPYRKARMADAEWVSEVKIAAADTSLEYGMRELKPQKLSKLVKVSKYLLNQSNADAEVRAEIDYVLAVTQEKAYLTGDGVGKPLGLFTASASGISTDRDIATDNVANAITADGLINAKYALKQQYQRRAEWMFHRDAVKMIAKLKDGEGQYLWQPSLIAGQPDRLLGLPLTMSEFVPNTFTNGLYVGIIGDFSHYWIADAMQMEIQVLRELYAAEGKVGYLVDYWGDGAPVVEEAFARVTLAP